METMENLLALFEEQPEIKCFVFRDNKMIFSSKERGVTPLLTFYEKFGKVEEIIVVDRIVGRGAVFLAILSGATRIVTKVVSSPALDAAKQFGILLEYEKEVPAVINRTKDGFCPIETAVLGENGPIKAYEKILEVLKKLQTGG